MLAVKAKVFDDGLYAAVELAAQRAKHPLLASLVGVAPTLAAAARLSGNGHAALFSRQGHHRRVSRRCTRLETDRVLHVERRASTHLSADRILERKLGRSKALALKAASKACRQARPRTNRYPRSRREADQSIGQREAGLTPGGWGLVLPSVTIARDRTRQASLRRSADSGWLLPRRRDNQTAPRRVLEPRSNGSVQLVQTSRHRRSSRWYSHTRRQRPHGSE